MTDGPKRHVIADPYPETIGLSAMTIFVPEDFCGDAEVVWWYPGKSRDVDKQRITCSASALLQGVLRDVRGARPTADEHLPAVDQLSARVVALVVHEFYKLRILRAAELEAAYEWRSYPPSHR